MLLQTDNEARKGAVFKERKRCAIGYGASKLVALIDVVDTRKLMSSSLKNGTAILPRNLSTLFPYGMVSSEAALIWPSESLGKTD